MLRALTGLAATLSIVLPAGASGSYVVQVLPEVPHGAASAKANKSVAAVVTSLDAAVTASRRLRKVYGGGARIVIELAPGRHRLAAPVRLAAIDSGSWTAPLVIRASSRGPVEITGAIALERAAPIADYGRAGEIAANVRGVARRYRLPQSLASAASIERARFHAIAAVPLAFEIFDDSGAMRPARWPNEGWAKTAASRASDHSFTFAQSPSSDQLAAWSRESDLWVQGHLRYDWSYESGAVRAVDAVAGRLTLADAPRYGLADGRRVFIAHALANLDQPGEWYRDRARGEIVVLPRPGGGAIEASLAENAFVIAGASHVRLEGFAITRFRGDAVVVTGGTGVVLDRVEIGWVAGRAATFTGAQASGVSGAFIHDTGEGGVVLEGGDRTTLSPSRQFVAESRFTRFSRLGVSYKPAIAAGGVGARLVGNVITDAPHMAILLGGNDHEVARNTIARVATDADDAGAIYIGRDWSARGTVIRANVLCDIRAAAGFEVKGIYLDDFASGITIEDNLMLRVDQPVFIGGGRDNVVRRNVLVGSDPAIHVDARGLSWARASVEDPSSDLRRALARMPVSTPLWRQRYPSLAGILADQPHLPKGNRLQGNLVVGGRWLRLQAVPDGVVAVAPGDDGRLLLPALHEARDAGDVARLLADAMTAAGVRGDWPRRDSVCGAVTAP